MNESYQILNHSVVFFFFSAGFFFASFGCAKLPKLHEIVYKNATKRNCLAFFFLITRSTTANFYVLFRIHNTHIIRVYIVDYRGRNNIHYTLQMSLFHLYETYITAYTILQLVCIIYKSIVCFISFFFPFDVCEYPSVWLAILYLYILFIFPAFLISFLYFCIISHPFLHFYLNVVGFFFLGTNSQSLCGV